MSALPGWNLLKSDRRNIDHGLQPVFLGDNLIVWVVFLSSMFTRHIQQHIRSAQLQPVRARIVC